MAGTDDAASNIITATGYQPWFNPVLTLPESWIEPLLVVQALIGASIIAYIVIRTRRKAKMLSPMQHKGHRHRHNHDEGHANLSAQIDSYAYTNQLAKVSPTTKIFFAVSMLLLSVLSASPIVSITVFIIIASANHSCSSDPRAILSRPLNLSTNIRRSKLRLHSIILRQWPTLD